MKNLKFKDFMHFPYMSHRPYPNTRPSPLPRTKGPWISQLWNTPSCSLLLSMHESVCMYCDKLNSSWSSYFVISFGDLVFRSCPISRCVRKYSRSFSGILPCKSFTWYSECIKDSSCSYKNKFYKLLSITLLWLPNIPPTVYTTLPKNPCILVFFK